MVEAGPIDDGFQDTCLSSLGKVSHLEPCFCPYSGLPVFDSWEVRSWRDPRHEKEQNIAIS
jgi:hypothetical protein